MSKTKVLITGVSGMLGKALFDTLNKENETYGTSRAKPSFVPPERFVKADFSKKTNFATILGKAHYDFIVHTAAITNIKYCELNGDRATNVNTKSVGKIAKIFSNSIHIYISTDSVFDGIKGSYTEKDVPNPINTYAKTKFLGENELIESTESRYILRCNMFGNTIRKDSLPIYNFYCKYLKSHNEITGFSNVFFNPLSVDEISKIVHKIMKEKKQQFGLYHLGSNRFLSKYEFLKLLDTKFKANIVKKGLFKQNGEIQRPLNTTLNNNKFKNNYNYAFKDMGDELDKLIRNTLA